MDFPPGPCPQFSGDSADSEGDAPGNMGFACDGLGCYGYSPINDTGPNLSRHPKIREIELHTAVVKAGDALFIPAFWFHHIHHLPRDGGGRNVALTYTQQRKWLNMSSMPPFAGAVMDTANRIDVGVHAFNFARPRAEDGSDDDEDDEDDEEGDEDDGDAVDDGSSKPPLVPSYRASGGLAVGGEL